VEVKLTLGQSGSPGRAFLAALTPESKAAIGAPAIELTTFPFRIGRESRKIEWTDRGIRSEKRASESKPNNEIYLIERTEPMNVSREHLQIEKDGDGYTLVDRKSTCGTIVEGDTVGGHNRGGQVSLRDGDVIIVGASISPYVFKFQVR
jgi:pSer/pThr/pTyr-binding forkhead associated (FHA) protein